MDEPISTTKIQDYRVGLGWSCTLSIESAVENPYYWTSSRQTFDDYNERHKINDPRFQASGWGLVDHTCIMKMQYTSVV